VDNMLNLRQACKDAMQACVQADQQAKQARDATDRRRQQAIDSARQTHQQARQQADSLLHETQLQAQTADQLLRSLNLQPAPISQPALPIGASTDQLVWMLGEQRRITQQTLVQLQTTAATLRNERNKWWKFW